MKLSRKLRSESSSFLMNFSLVFVFVIPLILIAGLSWKSAAVLSHSSLSDLLFSSEWSPMKGKFGFFPFIISSLWLTIISIIIAVPVCLFSAIHLTQYAPAKVLKIMHPVIDILAGIPSVVYGAWGVLVIVPFIRDHVSGFLGYESSGYSLISAAIVLAVMIIPFILNLMIEVIRIVPSELLESALSLGAAKWQAIRKVILKKALPGLVSAVGLGISRAFGETMAVLMVAGNMVKIPEHLFDASYPLPALIANNYGEMLTIPMYDSALMFAALILLTVVLIFNLLSRQLITKYENYR